MAPTRMFLRRALLLRRPHSTITTTTTIRSLSSAAPAASNRDASKPSLSSTSATANPSSSANAPATALPTASSSAGFRLPIKHSHKKLPSICTDPVQLSELTASILTASEGSLYMYVNAVADADKAADANDTTDNDNAVSIERDQAAAWEAANQVVQKVEYLIRGHAHTLKGTQWNRWLTSAASANSGTGAGKAAHASRNPTETLQTMQALLDRIDAEGRTYMTLRSQRLEELYGPKKVVLNVNAKVVKGIEHDKKGSLESFLYGDEPDDDDDYGENEVNQGENGTEVFQDLEALQNDIEQFAREEGEGTDSEEQMHVVENGQNYSGGENSNSHDTTEHDHSSRSASYRNDFASPGVTVSMYDALLDAMACQASSEFVTPTKAFDMVSEIVSRHDLDGGDEKNTNIHTRPTAVSYNAAIRIASELPFDMDSEEPEDIRMRDDALTVAFGAFDALYQSGVERNSATYHYLLLCVAKYFPASRIRGNVAHGMFHHAQEQGLVDADVVAAHLAANAPSNGPEFEEYMEKTLKGKTVNDLPHTWRRFNKVRRHHPRENVY